MMKHSVVQKSFDPTKSVLKDVYEMFSCDDPGELLDLYESEDQKLMYADAWDYKNETLLTNRIKNAIEQAGYDAISDEKERHWISNILWLWYHHAISCALWQYADKDAALEFSARALAMQSEDHPNKITRLLYLLIRDRLEEAEAWLMTITTEPEKSTAQYSVDLYRNGDFFKPQKYSDHS